MVDVEAILHSSALLEQVRSKEEHRELYHQLTRIQEEIWDLSETVASDDERRRQLRTRFEAVVVKFQEHVRKSNIRSLTGRGLCIGEEWRERLEIKAEVVHLKTSVGLVNLSSAVKTKTKTVADNSAAMVNKAKAKTDDRVAKVRVAFRDEQTKVGAKWDATLTRSMRGLSSLRKLRLSSRETPKRLENGEPETSDSMSTLGSASFDSAADMASQKSDQLELSSTGDATERTSDQLWHDDVIVNARIPRDMVTTDTFVSRGAFGEVYRGMYNGQSVAVKMLLPNTRDNMMHVQDFFKEVKVAAAMDHPHIVTFIGVAWDTLTSDLCCVTEFMEGGDLKALVETFKEQHYPRGFDYTKVKIALHVARALTYLHLLEPPVLHRDLKSKNILLSEDLDAKLTDFGISRELADRTMTAGVGTSLWMAPEVMLGKAYDQKADIFSFGVVLSELSTHESPYSHAKRAGSNQPLPLIAILHDITVGKLSVEFSDAGPDSVAELGRACVAPDPYDRPSAPDALYRLHTILTHQMSG